MIKITKSRAAISDHFESFVRDYYKQRLDSFKRRAESFRNKQYYYQSNSGAISVALDILKNRSSMDAMITKLRCLEYEEFGVMQTGDAMSFLAVTKPITIIDNDEHGRRSQENPLGAKYELGRYYVLLPFSKLLSSDPSEFHFAPEKNLLTVQRHPHHLAHPPYTTDYRAYRENYEWYEMRPDTCWGGFNTGILSAVGNSDLPDIFRLIQAYLSRYNIGSPKAYLNTYNFAWALP